VGGEKLELAASLLAIFALTAYGGKAYRVETANIDCVAGCLL